MELYVAAASSEVQEASEHRNDWQVPQPNQNTTRTPGKEKCQMYVQMYPFYTFVFQVCMCGVFECLVSGAGEVFTYWVNQEKIVSWCTLNIFNQNKRM